MTAAEERALAYALVDSLCGASDEAADRSVTVLNAHAAALARVHEVIGVYPAPPAVAAHLNRAAEALRADLDGRDPTVVLGQAAAEALAAHRASAAA
jgi:hypothetical protein